MAIRIGGQPDTGAVRGHGLGGVTAQGVPEPPGWRMDAHHQCAASWGNESDSINSHLAGGGEVERWCVKPKAAEVLLTPRTPAPARG